MCVRLAVTTVMSIAPLAGDLDAAAWAYMVALSGEMLPMACALKIGGRALLAHPRDGGSRG